MSSVLCSSMLHTYLLVCQILCVPLCCANPLSMSSVLCSFMLYKPLGYLCGMYFVFLYVVHTSWECFLSVSCFSMLYIILWQFGCFAFLSDGSYHLNISSGLFSYIQNIPLGLISPCFLVSQVKKNPNKYFWSIIILILKQVRMQNT